MTRVIPVLFGALFTVATAWSLGMLLFRRLALVFYAWEERLLAFVVGSACLSGIMFVLSATRLARRTLLLLLGLAIVGYALYSGVFQHSREIFSRHFPLCGAGFLQLASPRHLRWIFPRSRSRA